VTRLLQHGVAEQAVRRPDAPAVVMNHETLTYGQLDALTNRLARLLKATGCVKGDRVCLLQPKAPLAIVSILAVLKADCIYVPLDPASPPARLARIVDAVEPRCLLAAGPVGHLLAEIAGPRGRLPIAIGDLTDDGSLGSGASAAFTRADLAACAADLLNSRAHDTDPAHILFTSGSTGAPKGVVITHANVLHFIDWALRYFDTHATDRISGHPPLHFDLSTFDIFGTLTAGAALHLVPPEASLLPNLLADFIRRSRLTQWFSVPSALGYMAKFDVVRQDDFPALKRLLWCGEVLPTPVLQYWMRRLPHVTFTNLYGPTEATIASSYYTVPAVPADPTAPIPIGVPCDGEALEVLDDDLRPAPAGELGHLFIRGVGLSPGYWRDATQTSAAFLTGPDGGRMYRTGDLGRRGHDGLFHYAGRADSQIKSRGYRIELGEIEAAVNALPEIRESAVVALATDGFEGATICCAYVASPDASVTPAGLRQALTKSLPPYMLPARWLGLAALPKNANGKTDRGRVREQFREQDAHADRPLAV
jgi:amino acid adenylation domain-containing protein